MKLALRNPDLKARLEQYENQTSMIRPTIPAGAKQPQSREELRAIYEKYISGDAELKIQKNNRLKEGQSREAEYSLEESKLSDGLIVNHGISRAQLYNRMRMSGMQNCEEVVVLRESLLREIKESKIKCSFSEEMQAAVREKYDFSDIRAENTGLIRFDKVVEILKAQQHIAYIEKQKTAQDYLIQRRAKSVKLNQTPFEQTVSEREEYLEFID